MVEYVLSFKPAIGLFGGHDPSAAIFDGSNLLYAVEEERLIRKKHAIECFPSRTINACLKHAQIDLADLKKIVLPYSPKLRAEIWDHNFQQCFERGSILRTLYSLNEELKDLAVSRYFPAETVKRNLREVFGEPLPDIELRSHHRCHAASAFHLSPLDEALVLTIDGKGEYDSTVVWRGTPRGLERVRTYEFPNSMGHFFGAVTQYLGYRAFNGEGKIMGLAPYGEPNTEIERTLRELIDTTADYDVTEITGSGSISHGVDVLEEKFDRKRTSSDEFTKWEKDLAYVTQSLLEETVVNIVERYTDRLGTNNVALAGGVALNCKMNKRIMEMDRVDDLFIQPVANDAGLALGAPLLDYEPSAVEPLSNVYLGPQYSNSDIESLLETNKIEYETPNDLPRTIAEELANGQLVGWFQGKLEMGPRALGHRSILADPRDSESRDRVNRYVKNREGWRPFAPSMLEEKADEYLVNAEQSRYMIKTFETKKEGRDDIEAVLHPGDYTTRPHTVSSERNPRYHQLISEFEEITSVPVLLNTSFNDHGEPVVNTPKEALKGFYGMGLDILVLGDYVVRK